MKARNSKLTCRARQIAGAALILVGFGAAGTSGAAPADRGDEVPQIAVHYSASRLATDEGARELYHRLVQAAAQVCPAPTGTRLPGSVIRECRAQALARAVRAINAPRLASLYAADTKRS